MKKSPRKNTTAARKSQLLFLLLFLVLFLMTEYRGSDRISAAVNSYFRADPLAALSTMLAEKSYLPLLLPGLLVLFFALILGRFFCGWMCPLGTVIDLTTSRIKKSSPPALLKGNLKYWLLFPLLSASFFGLNLAGLLDPIAILLRALTFFLHPLAGESVREGWRGLYGIMGDKRDLLAPGYAYVDNYILPYRETLYPLAFLSALVLFLILLLERYRERCWCRYLCPLGTLLGLASRVAPFLRTPTKLCSDCGKCRSFCPTAFDTESFLKEECILCMQCIEKCQPVRAAFKFRNGAGQKPVMERRVVVGGLLAGFFLARFFRFRSPEAQARFLRPPGVNDENGFLRKCVRCGECMKVCLRSALYPALFQAGLEGTYTPVFIPRLGYCEYNCTLCGQVCPTGAIPDLSSAEKKRQVVGKAVIDKNHCIPFVSRTDCIVCEEHCPIPQKAIRSESLPMTSLDGVRRMVKQPYVLEDLCNGCGICENVCPLEGKAGIEVFSVKDKTPLKDTEDSDSFSRYP